MTISPDTKDWTWALTQACPDCGYDPTKVTKGDIAGLVRAYTRPWPARNMPGRSAWVNSATASTMTR